MTTEEEHERQAQQLEDLTQRLYQATHDPYAPAIALLEDFLKTLPDPHHEAPGVIRAIEVLRYPRS